MMKITISLAVIIALGVIAFVAWNRSSKVEPVEPGSFFDVVRNPEALPDLDAMHEQADAEAVRIADSQREIEALVHEYVFASESKHDEWMQRQVISRLGNKPYPAALAILRKPGAVEKLSVQEEVEDESAKAPINRICEIFDLKTPPPQAVAKELAPYLESEHEEIRKSVALIIGSTGDPSAFKALEKALHDSDGYVKSYALIGVQRAINAKRVPDAAKDDLFNLVAAMWPSDQSFEVGDDIPRILLQLNREKAVVRLLKDDVFSTKFEPVWRILDAFAEESVIVPRDQLQNLIKEASVEPIKYPMDNVIGGALTLLGQHRNQDDLAVLEQMLDNNNDEISEGAIKGLYIYHRYFEKIRDPWDVAKSEGWEALTDAEKYICAIERLDGEINNGGFAQYFFNSSGDQWKDALEGLTQIGAKKRAAIVTESLKKFKGSSPSEEREKRMTQLSRVARQADDPFQTQDEAWYSIKGEQLDVLMFKYNMANQSGRSK